LKVRFLARPLLRLATYLGRSRHLVFADPPYGLQLGGDLLAQSPAIAL